MDFCTNGIVITDAIKYVQGKMNHLNNQEKKLLQDIKRKQQKENEGVTPEKAEEGGGKRKQLMESSSLSGKRTDNKMLIIKGTCQM